MYPLPDDAAALQRFVEAGEEVASETAVVLVICVRGLTRVRRDYKRHSITSSFLSAEEFDDLVDGFREAGFFVRHFPEETDFIAWVLSGGFGKLPHKHKIVYTSALNGIGPGRRCLVPAFCALEGIPTLNSDAYSCAINRHKFHWNVLLRAFDLPAPTSWLYDPADGWFLDRRPPPDLMVIAKATYEGSSVGVTDRGIGFWSTDLERWIGELALDLQQPMVVQEFIPGDELEVPVLELGQRFLAMPVLVLKSDGSRLGDSALLYDAVWKDGYRYADPSPLDPLIVQNIANTALLASRALNFHGFNRIDFRVSNSGMPYVMDVSSTPHLTKSTSYAHVFDSLGHGYGGLMAAMVASGLARHGIIQLSDQY